MKKADWTGLFRSEVWCHSDYKFDTRYFEKIIESKYNQKISHNRIHNYLLRMGLAGEENKKKFRRWP